ncbi:MAG: peptidoglycan DD-metalloendopeptidase family protein, partial [Candidatus Colwellbacteria bacterium]
AAQTEQEIRAEIELREQEIERLRQEQELLGKNIAGTQAQAQTLQNKIKNLNGQIKYMENRINLTAANINKTSIEIGGAENNVATTQEKIDAQKKAVAQILLFLARQDNESLLALLLKYDNISDFLRQEHYANSLNANLVGLIDELRDARSDFEDQKSQLENKKNELERLKQQQGHERTALGGVRTETGNLLKNTKGKEVEYQKLLTEAEEKERQANLEVFRLEDKLRQAIDPNSLPLARPGVLAWPVRGTISQPYGCRHTNFARRYYPDCDNGKGGFHNGLDVAASYGTPLLAAEDGNVIAVGNAPSAYGVWLAVEHPNGLVTAYTHMSVRALNVGQEVKRGDMVGRMGSTGLSTGNHTHFMVYAPKTFTVKESKISGTLPIGATLNPQDYL